MKTIMLLVAWTMLQCNLFAGDEAGHGLVAHEWGTFTSLQGGDGELLNWKPLETSRLPGFVYDWKKPGLGRQATSVSGVFTKSTMITKQRMETPVVYFYSDKKMTVDLDVKFPKGLITEWFPQASQVGPSIVPPSRTVLAMDSFLHRCGAPAKLTVASLTENKNVKDSKIHWSNIELLPANQKDEVAQLLPTDTSGSHYFSARATDAAYLRLDSLSKTNRGPEYEKFLFYRGAGDFPTPLRVVIKSSNEVVLANTGTEALHHLFILNVRDQQGNFVYLDELQPGQEKTVSRQSPTGNLPLSDLTEKLTSKMFASLTAQGLYQREATAMVSTWKDSWFAEDGMRVLYLLPRPWTDRTLPMTINPAPKELVRVMVGRAEVLTPEVEQQLSLQVTKAGKGDPEAIQQVHATLQKLGRFGEPALYRALATAKAPSDSYRRLFALLTPDQTTGK
ncbi:MAG: hypothetical protein JWR19_4625 [Pedosphaera sp.]|nr:hypothetical protein [Pedosphaera sp.]